MKVIMKVFLPNFEIFDARPDGGKLSPNDFLRFNGRYAEVEFYDPDERVKLVNAGYKIKDIADSK